MTLGTAIFLSTLLISLLMLYKWTRDRWNWKMVLSGSVKYCVTIVLFLFAGGIAYSVYQDHFSNQDGIEEVNFGMTQDEVAYIKGYPTTVLTPYLMKEEDSDWKGRSFKVSPIDSLPKGKTFMNYLHWSYKGDDNEIDVEFDAKTKQVKNITCRQLNKGSCPKVQGISTYNSEKQVLTILGEPNKKTLEGTIKVLEYSDLHLTVYLMKKNVFMYSLHRP